jgi:type II secretory pathway pseudopilin PulG
MVTTRRARRCAAFSLVELLVVIGIIVLLTGMFLPSLMRSRRAAHTALCMNNLRQLGAFYYLYADQNRDLIPLGTSALPPEFPDYYTAWNNFVWRGTAPSSAGGPFLLGRMLKPGSAKIFYCPLEAKESFQWEMFQYRFERALNNEAVEIRSSYSARPSRHIWNGPASAYPKPMPKLVKQKHYALMAEYPQSRPFNHGEFAAPLVHALYADSSVRGVPLKAFSAALDEYARRFLPIGPGMNEPSNQMAFDENNETANTIWQNIDRY